MYIKTLLSKMLLFKSVALNRGFTVTAFACSCVIISNTFQPHAQADYHSLLKNTHYLNIVTTVHIIRHMRFPVQLLPTLAYVYVYTILYIHCGKLEIDHLQ